MASEWHLGREGQQSGPFTSQQLKEMAASGQLQPDDLVWKEGLSEWTPAHHIRGLFRKTAANRREKPPSEEVLACPHCAGHILCDQALAGQILACPHCGGKFQMPTRMGKAQASANSPPQENQAGVSAAETASSSAKPAGSPKSSPCRNESASTGIEAKLSATEEWVTIEIHKTEPLPALCMRCGVPTDQTKVCTLKEDEKKITVTLPLCQKHRRIMQQRGCILALLTGLLSLSAMAIGGRVADSGSLIEALLIFGVSVVILTPFYAVCGVLKASTIHPVRVRRYRVTVAGVSPVFVAALEVLRAQQPEG